MTGPYTCLRPKLTAGRSISSEPHTTAFLLHEEVSPCLIHRLIPYLPAGLGHGPLHGCPLPAFMTGETKTRGAGAFRGCGEGGATFTCTCPSPAPAGLSCPHPCFRRFP